MAKKFMPLWIADVMRVEERLRELSRKGVHLTGFSPAVSVFSFEKGGEKEYRYRICLSKKCGGNVPKGLINAGWEKVCGTKNSYVVRHENADIEKLPDYKNNKTLNRVFFYAIIIGLTYFVGFYLGAFSAMLEEGDFTDVFSPAFAVHIAATVVLAMMAFFFGRGNRRLAKTDSNLGISAKGLRTIPDDVFIYSKEQEKEMLRAKTMKKISPFAWYLEPDRIAEKVEKMALEGWKFYRFSKMGNELYFIKSEPCRLKFVADYQTVTTDEYYLSAKDDGWKLCFTSVTRVTTFIVWVKEYADDDEEPQFYSERETMLESAKQLIMSFVLPMLVFMVLMVVIALTCITDLIADNGDSFIGYALAGVYAVIIIEYAVIAFKGIGYYIRLKSKG